MNEQQLEQFKIDREEFKAWRKVQYAEKELFLKSELIEDTKIRELKVKVLESKLASMFYQIIDGLITTPEFNNSTVPFHIKNDMKSQAMWAMYSYIERYDVRKTNPFSYFTEIAKNEFRKIKDEYNLQQIRCTPTDHIENLDDQTDSNWLL